MLFCFSLLIDLIDLSKPSLTVSFLLCISPVLPIDLGSTPTVSGVKPDIPLTYGKSITDACIDLEVSEDILSLLANAVKQRL